MFENKHFHLNKLLKRYGERWKNTNKGEIRGSHFIDASGLFERIQAERDPLSQYLHSQLDIEHLHELKTQTENPNDEESPFREALVDNFNKKVLSDSELYKKAELFGHVRLSPEAHQLIKEAANDKGQLSDEALRYLNRVLLEEAYPDEISNDLFQINKIQLVNQGGYEYVKDRGNKYFYLQCLLHGAAHKLKLDGGEKREKEQDGPADNANGAADKSGKKGEESGVYDDFEESLKDFLIKDLQLLFGMYCFIDSRSGDEVSANSYYLTGPFDEEHALTPSFTFPFYVNTRNIRNSREFHRPPDEWLAFYLDLNAATREHLPFKDDFVKFFGSQKWRRNQGPETRLNLFYASSGEIDHTILQWLFCSLTPDISLDGAFKIPVARLFTRTDVKKALDDEGEHKGVINRITAKVDDKRYLLPNTKDKDEAESAPLERKIDGWLQNFGLLNDTNRRVPTERMLAAIEFFYFHLKHWAAEGGKRIGLNTETYFSRGNEWAEENYYGYRMNTQEGRDCEARTSDFIRKCEETLPVLTKTYDHVRKEITSADELQERMQDVVNSYLSVLQAFALAHKNDEVAFNDYGRFNILSHFFQRNVLPLYNPLLKEQTCRGFIIIPIFSNPHESTGEETTKDKNTKDLGYFLGLIKDSDSKGRCYFNWRTHSDNRTESETIEFFYKEYLFHLQSFVYNLGFKEVKQIYYKGIEERHTREIKRQATHAAIAEIINRNQAHHIGSHVSTRATLDKVLERLGRTHRDLCDESFYLTVLDLLNRLNQYRDERSDYLTYLAEYSSPSAASLFKDVLQPFIENTLLMDNIAATEGINYAESCGDGDLRNLCNNKLRLRVKLKGEGEAEEFKASYMTDDGRELYNSENLPYLRWQTAAGFRYESVDLNRPDIEVSLPGALGKHALYSFMENFIRNSAKHGSEEKSKSLVVNIELSNLDDPDYVNVKVSDNCSVVDEKKIEAFKNSIKTPILEKKDLGLIDMKVNACLLEGKELTDENCYEALTPGRDDKGLLYYEFKIAKPKKAVFIGCPPEVGQKNANGYFYYDSVEAYINASISKSFRFAVVDEGALQGLQNDPKKGEKERKLFNQLPARVLYYREVKDYLPGAEVRDNRLLTALYGCWVDRLSRGLSRDDESNHLDARFQVHLYSEQSENESPTREFKNCKSFSQHPFFKVYSKEDLNVRVSFEAEKRHIFFDRHGVMIKRFKRNLADVKEKHCWILTDKNNPDLDYISRYDLDSSAEILPYELAEAGLLSVLIIDERAAEQSCRIIQPDNDDRRKIKEHHYGFTKFDLSAEKNKLTLFDTAWAVNVFIATHLNEVALKGNIEPEEGDKHILRVDVTRDDIKYNTNITSLYGEYKKERGSWEITGEAPRLNPVELKPDILVIHRTKLKELIDRDKEAAEKEANKRAPLIERLTSKIRNVIVTTGSGTTHGIDGDFKILPFSTLNELVLGKRVRKLRLSRILLELTKNKI